MRFRKHTYIKHLVHPYQNNNNKRNTYDTYNISSPSYSSLQSSILPFPVPIKTW